MKTKMLFFVMVVAVTATIISCTKNKEEKLTPEQKVLFGKMKVTYETAKTYNDSLMNCDPSNNSYTMLTNLYDSCYHANDSIFNNCHSDMMNTEGGIIGDNHGMMGSHSGMMSGNHTMCNTQNDEFNQVMGNMNQLRNIHNSYHLK